jgi:hypothetical protein
LTYLNLLEREWTRTHLTKPRWEAGVSFTSCFLSSFSSQYYSWTVSWHHSPNPGTVNIVTVKF